jgi:hypothetical protein
MRDSKLNSTSVQRDLRKEDSRRVFESETLALKSLRLIAAPNPEDDLSDEELADMCNSSQQSPELIQHLIKHIKSI